MEGHLPLGVPAATIDHLTVFFFKEATHTHTQRKTEHRTQIRHWARRWHRGQLWRPFRYRAMWVVVLLQLLQLRLLQRFTPQLTSTWPQPLALFLDM